MSSFKRIATLLLVLFYLYDNVTGHPDLTLVSGLCNSQGFDGSSYESSYQNAVEEIFQGLITHTPFSDYNFYYTSPVVDDTNRILDTFYGHGACNGVITVYDCANCLIAVAGLIRNDCPSRFGAAYQLKDCRIRYEIYPFTDQ
ncbi:hypothetical protein NL676_030506 [Syzygium grande]|nr:hypothetical protein NL676_030506 [Syzygium grande]